MQSSSLSTPGQTPSHNPSGLAPNPTNPVQPSHGDPTSSAPPIPASGILPMTANEKGLQRTIPPTFPIPGIPQRRGTEPMVSRTPTTYPLQPIQSAPPFAVPQRSIQFLGSHLAGSDLQQGWDNSAARVRALFESLVYPEGEIPVFDNDDADSRTLIRCEPVVTQKRNRHIPWWKIWKISSSRISWTDAYGALLDSHFLVVEPETNPTGVDKSTHVFRPIPLEYLSLASLPGPTKQQMYPLTIYHVAAKLTRRHTIYTKTKTERNKWRVALEEAIEARKSQQDAKMLYAPHIFIDGFFKIPPRIRLDREARYTGRVACAALFTFREEFLWESWPSPRESYIAIGCTSGIYVSKRTERTEDYLFRKILEFNEPNSMVAFPESNKFLVHCESRLSSYPLDKVIRAFHTTQGNATIKDLGASEEKLAEDVLFLKAGRLVETKKVETTDQNQTIERIVVIYAVKSSEKVTSHVLEVKCHDPISQAPAKYLPLGPPVDIPEEPHDATCFVDKVAICTSTAVYFVEPMNTTNPDPVMVPRLAKEAREKSKLLGPFQKGRTDKPKIVELVGKASVLGMVKYEWDDHDYFLVYDNLGYFVDEVGKPSRANYYIEWERKATAFVRRGPHILLFSRGYIEVRYIETGKLVQMVEVNELRLLRSSLTEGRLLVGVITGSAEADGSRTEKLVELVYNSSD